jgi:hypothetical protein
MPVLSHQSGSSISQINTRRVHTQIHNLFQRLLIVSEGLCLLQVPRAIGQPTTHYTIAPEDGAQCGRIFKRNFKRWWWRQKKELAYKRSRCRNTLVWCALSSSCAPFNIPTQKGKITTKNHRWKFSKVIYPRFCTVVYDDSAHLGEFLAAAPLRRVTSVQPRLPTATLKRFTFDAPSNLRILHTNFEPVDHAQASHSNGVPARSVSVLEVYSRPSTSQQQGMMYEVEHPYNQREAGTRHEQTTGPKRVREHVHLTLMSAYAQLRSGNMSRDDILRALRATHRRDHELSHFYQWIYCHRSGDPRMTDLLGDIKTGDHEHGLVEFFQYSLSPHFLLASYARRKVLLAGYAARGGREVCRCVCV